MTADTETVFQTSFGLCNSKISALTIQAIDERINRPSLTDSVYQRLVELIVSGQLAPGMKLGAQELADHLGVSRTPVTEALQCLAHDGIVDRVKHHGARVGRLSRADVVEIYEIRGNLELLAVEKAAKLIDRRAIKKLRSALDTLVADRGRPDWIAEAIQSDALFHDTLAASSGNVRLQKEIARYRVLTRCFCRPVMTEERMAQVLQEHLAILDALDLRDTSAAREAMAFHIDATLEEVLRELFPA